MDDKKRCCPNCNQIYVVNFASAQVKLNLPLFLPCGHSMCEKCITSIVKCMEPIECKVCQQDADVATGDVLQHMLDKSKSKLYELFPVNNQLVGEMILQVILDPDTNINKSNDEDHFVDLKALLNSTEFTKGKCLECNNVTSKMCLQCATILCDTCFNKTHKNFIIFKSHVHQSIEAAMMPVNNCKLHTEKTLDYYCKDCEKSICMDCMMVGGDKSCKNHNVVSMQEVNEEFLEELTNVAPQVDETFRRLTKSAVDIGYLLYNFENENGSAAELNKMVASIEQHFSKLASIVQKHKNEVIDIVLKLKNSEKESLLNAKTEVVETIKKAKHVMNIIKSCTDAKKQKQINLASLLADAKQIAEARWYLNRDETNTGTLKLTVNEDICLLINDYIHLEGNKKSDYKLYSTKELGDDTDVPAAPTSPVYPPELCKDVRQTQKPKVERVEIKEGGKKTHKSQSFYKHVPQYRSKSGSISSLNSSNSDLSNMSYVTQNECYQKPVVHPVSPFAESKHPKQLYEGAQELIYISHIVDPHNFYVQRACHQGLVKEMLREFRNGVSLPKPSINHITQGKIYLVFNKADDMWQRCRVISIERNQANVLFQVFCFDFGSTETVSVDRLRLLPPARVQSPYPLALNCSLANCEPKNGTWTSDDSFLIQNIIDNKQAVIHIRRIISTSNTELKLDCDVTTFEHGVSLAHALVFHDRAKMPNPKLPYPRTATMSEKPKIFMGQNDYKAKAVEEVYITHIASPDKIFVRKRHLQQVYEKLSEDLEQEYSMNSSAGSVYLPVIDMVCVVNMEKYRKSSEDAPWARGYVTECPGRGRLRVLLLDTGELRLLHWTALRYIHPAFTTLRALASECHLAGITPLNKKWSPGSVELLQKYENQLLELHVEENRDKRGRGSIGVTLYDKQDEENIVCLNNEMIKYKFAISFGIYMFNKNTDEQQVNIVNLPFNKPTPKIKANPEEIKSIKILKKNQPSNINDEDLGARDKGPLRLEAKVLHYQSPSLIYISLVHQQKTFYELFEMMQKYYSKKTPPAKDDWAVGDRCCSLCKQSQTWRRAVILEVEGDNAKLFYTDFACVETVPTSTLKVLTPEFDKIGDAAIKCHLSGVIPAVGEEWPSLTKEYLKELIDAYTRMFITKIGNFKDKSMPIEIWVYHTTPGGALEPNKSEWRCLNNKIVEQGLGIPDKSQIPQTNVSNNEDERDDDMLSFLNVTGSVNQWLQLEPMPTVPVRTQKSESESYGTPSPTECDDSLTKTEDANESSNVMYISDWLPPEPLPRKEFTALPTYIDNDGLIYLHDVSQQDTLDLIRKALDVRFKGTDPKAKFNKWAVGEPCIALYYLDNRFYRGRVLEVNKEKSTCIIHYIDYGNEEICSYTNMRKSIALHQIPIQAHKCALNRIRPVGKQWERQTLDYIHKSVVEKQCYVKVVGEPVNGITPIELKYDKLWINDHLVDFEMAEYTDGSKAAVKRYAPVTKIIQEVEDNSSGVEFDEGPDYIIEDDPESVEPSVTSHESLGISSLKGTDWNKLLEEEKKQNTEDNFIAFPKISDVEFTCSVNLINNIDTLTLTLFQDEDTTAVYEQLFEELQTEAESMPPLNGIYENKACLAVFPEDGKWYRASILEYSETKNQIKVRYVDYGNVDVILLSDTRELNEEWAKLPPATVPVKLDGVRVNPDIDMNVVIKEYTETFLEKGPFNAKIVNYENVVPIVELRNEDGELVYNKLIENNVFLKTE